MSQDVKIHKKENYLKAKLGVDIKNQDEGQIDPAAIAEADRLIEELCANCAPTLAENVEQLQALWTDMRDLKQGEARDTLAGEIFTVAHEIKDIGAMCGYTLMAHFGESLRDYINQTELSMDAQRIIIQAHVDALIATQKQGIKDEENAITEELKKVVRIAVEKYS